MDNAQQFIVATNNDRTNSSAPFILGTGKAFDIVWASPDANREVVPNHVKAQKTLTRIAKGSSNSWRFAKVATTGKVLFKAAPNERAVAQAAGLTHVRVDRQDDSGGYGIYRIALDA